MRPLRNLEVAVLDFEATDYAGPEAHVVEVAIVLATLGGDAAPRLAFASLVKPPIQIPDRVSQIHGIRDADVVDAPRWADIVDEVLGAIGGRPIVAFNAPSDHTFARVEQERLGRPAFAWPWLDLLVVRKATKTRGRPGRLGEIAQEHGITLDAHGAAGDALTTAMLLTPLMRAAWNAGAFRDAAGAQPRNWRDDDPDDDEPPPRLDTLEAFFTWQRGAALYQERDYADYCKRKGDAYPPRCDWHVIEGVEPPTWAPPARGGRCPSCAAAVLIRVAKDGTRSFVELTGGDAPHVCAR